MSISFLQSLTTASSGLVTVSSLQSAAFASNVTAHSSIIVTIWNSNVSNAHAVTSVTDTEGNTYIQDAFYASGGYDRCDVWRADNVVGGDKPKITVNFAGNTYVSFTAAEFSVSGQSLAVDAGPAKNGGTSPTQPSSGSLTTSNANTLLIATVACFNCSAISAGPTGFTNIGKRTSGGSGEDGSSDYNIVSSVQTGLVASWSATIANSWSSFLVSWREASLALPSGWQPFLPRPFDPQPPEPPPLPSRWSVQAFNPFVIHPPPAAGPGWIPFPYRPNPAPPPEFFDTPRRLCRDALTRVVTKHVAQRVTFSQANASLSPAIYPLIPNSHPLNFARAPTGDVYMASGLIPMLKWDGVRYAAQTVGVGPPAAALTITPSTQAGATPWKLSLVLAGPVGSTAVSGSVTGALSASASGVVDESPEFSGIFQFIQKNTFTYQSICYVNAPTTGNLAGTLTAALIPDLAPTLNGFVIVDSIQLSGSFTGHGTATFAGVVLALPELPVGTPALQIGQFSGTVSGNSGLVDKTTPLPAVLTGTYTAYERFLDADGNPSNLSPISNSVTLSAQTIQYTAVPVPTDPKVTRRQILRNTTGQATTYYVTVDTTDLSATSFTDTFDDETLATQTAVALFDTGGNTLANRYTVPPADKPYLAAYLDHMFAGGDVTYNAGHAEVTNGSATVQGVGTQWTTSLAGRFLYVTGVNQPYQIASADPVGQTLTLTGTYQNGTDAFAVYAIKPAPAERGVVYFSEPGLPEAWPPANGLTLEQNGDEVTGLMAAESFLYILQRKHVYRLTYHLGPLVDGGLFLAARRGCVNNRSWVYFDGHAYLLDEQGVYRFGGGTETESLSADIQDVFWVDRSAGGLRINWAAQRWFHALHCKDERTIRWFVALSGSRLPRHALCYNYDSKAWWVEQFAFDVGASVVTDGPTGLPFLAGPSRRVFQQGVGSLDGPDPKAGTTRAQAAAGGAENLTGPAGVVYPVGGVVGSPIGIYDGRGKGGWNLVASVSGSQVRCVRPWHVQPDGTSKFQLGGFPWVWDGGDYRWIQEEGDEQRRVEVVFPPTATPAQCDLRVYSNFSLTPDQYGADWPACPADADAIRTTAGSADAVIDLSYQYGMAPLRRAGRRELYVQNADVFSVELAGFSAESPVSIYEVNLDGAEQ